MKSLLLSTIQVTFTLLLLVTPPQVLAQSHCDKKEIDYFSCEVKGTEKLLSVCGSSLVAGSGPPWLQYRFGFAGKPEMVYPLLKARSFEKFAIVHFHPSMEDHDVLALRFESGAAKYEVGLSQYSNRPKRERLVGGVSVAIDKRSSNFTCRQPIESRYLVRFHSLFTSAPERAR